MNKIIFLIIFLFPVLSFSATRGVPFIPEIDQRFSDLETLGGLEVPDTEILVGNASGDAAAVAVSGDATLANTGALTLSANSVDSAEITAGSVDEDKLVLPTIDGKNAMRVVRANLDCTASSCVAGTVSMVQTLPANAAIYQTWWFVEEQFVDGGSGTVALFCEDDTGNIFTAADITGDAVGAFVAGNATGVIATMTGAIAAECTITARIAVAEQTAGIMNLWIMYTVHD